MFRQIANACLVASCLIASCLGSVTTLAAEPARSDKVSFYFAAHEDDWQLFMNPSAFQDVIDGTVRTVFVYVTAGDAGLGSGAAGRKYPLYLARENGARQAVRFMADASKMPDNDMVSTMSFNGHPIHRVSYQHTVSYFLRVPDGNPLGTGYAHTGFQSLQRLATGDNTTLTAIDGSTTYHGWRDLVDTVSAIISYERGQTGLVKVNVAELDPRINPDDHSDHLMTAKAAIQAARLPCVRLLSYVDYASSKLPENLDAQQRDMESSVFAVTLSGVQALDHPTSWQHYNASYVGRNYFRVQKESGSCESMAPEFAANHVAP